LLLSIVLLTQSVLTFSRGGVLNVLIAIPLAFLHLLGSPNKLMKGVFALLIIFLVAYFLLLPELEDFTGGALQARYTDISLTGREDIARADIELWLKNPVLGVGPGLSSNQRLFMQGTAAHTEYSRILAEHGILGLLSFFILALLLIFAYFKAPDAYARAWVVAIAAWPLLEMVHAAMRIAAISFMLGLALIGWGKTEETTVDEENQNSKPRLNNVKRKFRT
jgi:O-antigen ligase